jgi:hypothetical protein
MATTIQQIIPTMVTADSAEDDKIVYIVWKTGPQCGPVFGPSLGLGWGSPNFDPPVDHIFRPVCS